MRKINKNMRLRVFNWVPPGFSELLLQEEIRHLLLNLEF